MLHEKVVIDKSGANKGALDRLNIRLALLFLMTGILAPILVRQIKYLNNLVEIDAMGCQQEIAKKIVDKKADYVLALKDNQPNLCQNVASIFKQAEECQYKKMIHTQKKKFLF